jgi:excisionase family DNA binding protein
MQAVELPPTGYTMREAGNKLGLSEKYLDRLVRDGKIDAYVDGVGQMRVSREDLYRVLRERGSKH